MHRLLEIGFKPAGHWSLDGENLVLELSRQQSQKNVLYSFVCDGEVKYVGKTTRTLLQRMAGYRKPGSTQSTNIRNHGKIKEQLASGAAVEILALPDNGLLHYGAFHVNLAAGLEDDIIRTINPEWNGGRRETAAESEAGSVDAEESPGPMFTFILQPTYARAGFFNVGVANDNLFGSDGETIEIYCGTAERPILGIINRRSNKNETPRIMGGSALRDWFQENATVRSNVNVNVLSPTAIRLMTPSD